MSRHLHLVLGLQMAAGGGRSDIVRQRDQKNGRRAQLHTGGTRALNLPVMRLRPVQMQTQEENDLCE